MSVLIREDFEGEVLDPTRWSTGWFGAGITHPVNGHETAAYDPSCVSLRNGKLHLRLKNKPAVVGGTRFLWTTGCITSRGKFSTPADKYYVEARIHLIGEGEALYDWPAFWTDGLGTWPNDGENDVLEGLGGRAAYHYHSPSGSPGASFLLAANAWHLFRAEVRVPNVSYFYDQKPVGSVNNAIAKEHMVIFANQAGSYGGKTQEGDMKVDYFEMGTL